MTSKEIRRIAQDQLYVGKSYQEVYDELNATFPNREIDLARIVSREVSNAQRKKYGTLNIILMVLLVISIGIKVVTAIGIASELGPAGLVLTLILPAASVAMLVGVVRWRMMAYSAVGILGLMGMFGIVDSTIIFQLNIFDVQALGLIGLGFFMFYTLGGKYKTSSQQIKDAKGQIRAKHKIVFTNM